MSVELQIDRNFIEKLLSTAENEICIEEIDTVSGIAFLLLNLAHNSSSPIIAITDTTENIYSLEENLIAIKKLLPHNRTLILPLPGNDKISRLSSLIKLIQSDGKQHTPLIVTSPAVLKKGTIGKEEIYNNIVELRTKEEYNYKKFIDVLEKLHYTRVDYVTAIGEYSIRGGIIDLWVPIYKDPIRTVWEYDSVEEIKFFNVETQLSYPTSDTTPKTFIITPLDDRGDKNIITEYFSPDSIVIFTKKTEDLDEVQAMFTSLENKKFIHFTLAHGGNVFNAQIYKVEKFNSKIPLLVEKIDTLHNNGVKTYIFCSNEHEMERTKELILYNKPEVLKNVTFEIIPIDEGFYYPPGRFIIITPQEIFSREKIKYKLPKFSLGDRIESLEEIHPGDYVVHEDYGIGLYQGIIQRISSKTKIPYDSLEILYSGGDKLYVPVQYFYKIQKYVGPPGYKPTLSKLDIVAWERIKNNIRKKTNRILSELVKLYVERSTQQGIKFSEDSYIEKTFANEFPYEETEDQERAITETLSDMVKGKLMDRVIIGDVGYGKTEVAMRAALKAVLSGKQVMVLVPTTILAEQHYRTFKQRFDNYPVNISMLSRLVNKQMQKTVIDKIKKHEIDIVIGTTRLLQQDVVFDDLGLLIIDDEHKFGVRDKEKIKYIKSNVAVLSLSATPIPRTLSMVLNGIKDVSIIETPPYGRLPIETYLLPYDEKTIKEAIYNEFLRHGQTFYVHNHIDTIYHVKQKLETLLPEIRFCVVHGKMKPREIENNISLFLDRKYDVLLSTTIIEAGIDLPNVNTIIVENAHEFGLAQLYQLRGRVGRSDKKAYCYLLYPPNTSMTEEAKKRLKALREFISLGSGYKLALRDLEIRGAGNIFGVEQHGFIAQIGYNLYLQILAEEVKKIKGEQEATKGESYEPEIYLPYNATIPPDYISSAETRVIFYRRLLSSRSEDEISKIESELVDRFGKMPQEVENLIRISALRMYLVKHQVKTLEVDSEGTKFFLARAAQNEKLITYLTREHKMKISKSDPSFYILYSNRHFTIEELLQIFKNIN